MSQFPRHGKSLLDTLRSEILVGDGAMGTLLYSRGVPLDANFEHLNLVKPDLVRRVHQDYAHAGARLVETNTFGANALKLGTIGLEGKVRSINLAGARIARAAVQDDVFVAGSVGPLLRPRGEGGEFSSTRKRGIFQEQMEALAEGGVDLFICETFSSLDDLETAVIVARRIGLPVVAQMAFIEDGLTRDGVRAEDAALRLVDAGAAVLGANCGGGPRELLRVLKRMAAVTDLPLSAFPNSGFPQYVDGRSIYLATPEYFASMARDMVMAGASLVGGCCGTTPEHIAALATALKGITPSQRFKPEPIRAGTLPEPVLPGVPTGTFLDSWGERPVITVELDPPKGLDPKGVLENAHRLAEAGVDAISLAENPLARIRMGNLALAAKIQEETGVDVIAHVTCRDRNLIGLHSDLMGAHLMGIRNILAVTGDPVAVGGESGATSVYDLNSVGLIELLSALNSGRSLLGADLGGATHFLVGGAFNPNVARMEGQIRRLKKKIAAGACFVQTQPVYSRKVLDELVDRTAPLGIPVLVGILPLVSERNAEFLHNEVPGISLPDEVRRRMKGKAGDEGVREGMSIAVELIEGGKGKVGGWYLMPPFGKVKLALDLMREIRKE